MIEDGGKVISQILDRIQEPQELFLALKEIGFTDEDLAEGTGTDPRTVRRWRKAEPGTVAARHLAEIRNIVSLLGEGDVLTTRGIVFWLRHPNRLLRDYSPISVAGAGGFRSALGAAECFCDSERPFAETLEPRVVEMLEERERANREGGARRQVKKLEPVA